jgi:isoaspartyl peptidase/L-asparaginase-like protein (Ntn-hydrolase superfamily)
MVSHGIVIHGGAGSSTRLTVAAVAVTGIGEEIRRKMLAKTVYDFIPGGQPIKTACEKGVSLFPPEISVGIVAISREGYGVAANRRMAAYGLAKEA